MNTVTTDYAEMTIGKIVAKDFRKAMVFKSHDLDFCCGGNIRLKDATDENQLDIQRIVSELEAIDAYENTSEDYESWSTEKLVNHIITKHHGYVSNTIMQLTPMINKVEMVHGGWRPELIEVNSLYAQVCEELTLHMRKEEAVLFPAILDLSKQANSTEACFGSVKNPITAMEDDHEIVGNLMKQIHDLTDGYTLPKGACATYTVVYKTLQEFEDDLFVHIHLENNILFPRAIKMEEQNN